MRYGSTTISPTPGIDPLVLHYARCRNARVHTGVSQIPKTNPAEDPRVRGSADRLCDELRVRE